MTVTVTLMAAMAEGLSIDEVESNIGFDQSGQLADFTPGEVKSKKELGEAYELLEVLDRGALSAGLSPEQKARKVSNLLQKMKAEKQVEPRGPRNKAKWHLL